jgi:hypothetical protein
MATRGKQPTMVTKRAAASALGCHVGTISYYIATGQLTSTYVHSRHYTDDRPRKTTRGRVYITVRSIQRLIAKRYAGLHMRTLMGRGPR